MFEFEKFPVYILSEKTYQLFTKEIVMKKNINARLKDQLERASSSIVLNIAEGAGKYSKKEKKNYYLISRASAQECVAIIRLLKLRENISEECYQKLHKNLEEICKMLSGLINHFLKP